MISLCQILAGVIGCPYFGKPVARDLVAVLAISGRRAESPLLPGSQALLSHEPGDAVLATPVAQIAELHAHPWAAVGAAALFKAFGKQGRQLRILPAAWGACLAAMSLTAAMADLQGISQRLDEESGFGAFPLL